MERLENIRSRLHLPVHGARGLVVVLAVLVLLAALLIACQGAATPTGTPPPAYLRLVPCGGESQSQWSGSSQWRPVKAPITLDREARIAAEGDAGGRLCAADGSVLELAAGSTVDAGPNDDGSCLQITLQEGSLLFLATGPGYQFAAPGCVLRVSEVPARVSVERNSEATRLRVEQGRAALVMASETITVETCAEIIAAPGAEPEVGQYCDATPQPTPTSVTLSPTPMPPTNTPTATPTPTSTPSATPTSTPTPTPTRRIFPTNTPTPLPATDTPVATSPPPTDRPQDTAVPPSPTPDEKEIP